MWGGQIPAFRKNLCLEAAFVQDPGDSLAPDSLRTTLSREANFKCPGPSRPGNSQEQSLERRLCPVPCVSRGGEGDQESGQQDSKDTQLRKVPDCDFLLMTLLSEPGCIPVPSPPWPRDHTNSHSHLLGPSCFCRPSALALRELKHTGQGRGLVLGHAAGQRRPGARLLLCTEPEVPVTVTANKHLLCAGLGLSILHSFSPHNRPAIYRHY